MDKGRDGLNKVSNKVPNKVSHKENENGRTLAESRAVADAIEDYLARRLSLTDGRYNVDPYLIVAAEETAMELLAEYLAHARFKRAERNLVEGGLL